MLHLIIIKATYSSFKTTTMILHLIIIKATYSSFKIPTMMLHIIIIKATLLLKLTTLFLKQLQ